MGRQRDTKPGPNRRKVSWHTFAAWGVATYRSKRLVFELILFSQPGMRNNLLAFFYISLCLPFNALRANGVEERRQGKTDQNLLLRNFPL
jgi:hypothetical protein